MHLSPMSSSNSDAVAEKEITTVTGGEADWADRSLFHRRDVLDEILE